MNSRFEIRRADGRSDAQVIIDLVGGKTPGVIFSFAELASALGDGCAREFDEAAVRSAVNRAERRLLSEQSRTLLNVRGHGYKVAHAGEHSLIARNRKARSDVLLRKGMHTLRNVRWDEMDDNQRAAHEGTLLVLGAVMAAHDSIRERQDRIEKRLREVMGK